MNEMKHNKQEQISYKKEIDKTQVVKKMKVESNIRENQ